MAVNRGGEIVLANPRAEALFGYEREELVGRRLEVLIPDRVRPVHGQHEADYFAQPRTRPMGVGLTLTARRKDGAEFPIEVSLTHIPDNAGGLAVAFVTDISERVAHEHQIRHQEKLVALGTLAAGIAHELNNPIGIILSRIELMLMDMEDVQGSSGDVVDDLRVLHRQAQRLSRIAGGLLSYGRRQQPDRQPVDVTAVVRDTLSFAGRQLSRDRIALSTTFDADLPRVFGDATALQQAVMNLLLNARDAMPDGGRLRIAATLAPEPPAAVRLVVADTGGGMSADVLARIAQPFFTTKPHGTGLGLSVTYTIIREHAGVVAVASEPGHGTTFTITLPGIVGGSTK